MILKVAFFIIPTCLFIIFTQLHRIPSIIASILYVLICGIYLFMKNDKIHIKVLKNCQKYFLLGNILVFLFILLLVSLPIGGYLTVPLILPHSTEKADAVVVLASGATYAGEPSLSTYQRVIHGAKLLKNGQAKHLYISTGFSKLKGFQEYYAVASLTKILDIPQDKITIFKSEEIVTTATEAVYAKKRMDELGINKILLTTSNAHIYRSYLTFKKLGLTVLPAPCHNKETTVYADDNFSMFRAAMHEWLGLVWYYFKGRI